MEQINNISLYNGDCLEIMPTLPDKSVDCIITDLPYGTTACKWDNIIPFEPMWEQFNRVCKGAIVLFATEPFASALRMSNINDYRYDWVWIKTKAGNFALSRKNPMKLHEHVLVFYKKFPTYNLFNIRELEKPILNSRKNKGANLGHCKDAGGYMQTQTGFHKSTLYYSNKSGKGYSFHPTQKPVALLEYLIKTYSNEGDSILDATMGSGSTMVACVNTNRRGIGIEMRKEYFDIAVKRVNEATH